MLCDNYHFYPFGNTAPTYVLLGEAEEVLLLAAGDLRHALYSLVRDASRRHPVHFTVNDSDTHIVARDVLLVWLSHHAPPEHTFAVWFSLGLTAAAHASLHGALQKLTSSLSTLELEKAGIKFRTPMDRNHVLAVLQEWSVWIFDWQSVQAQRTAFLDNRWLRQTAMNPEGLGINEIFMQHAEGVLFPHRWQQTCGETSVFKRGLPIEAAQTEIVAYLKTGVVAPLEGEKTEMVNPTLFRDKDQYEVHYGANPFLAFPLFVPSYDDSRPLATVCHAEFARWVEELRERKGSVSWTFALGDCTELCGNLHTNFDVISTTNVADHVGLLPLLQAVRLVVKPGGFLLTSTLLHLSFDSDTASYLQTCLLLPPELWPGVLGWRCLGYEGKLAPKSSEVQFALPDYHAMASAGKNKAVRSEANFIWTAMSFGNLPLELNNPAILNMVDSCRLEYRINPLGINGGVPPKNLRAGMDRLHLQTLQSLLYMGFGADSLLRTEDVETSDLLAYMQGDGKLAVACVPLRDLAIESMLHLASVLSISNTVETQPHLCIVLYCADGSTSLYSALWIEGTGRVRNIKWLVEPSKVVSARAVLHGDTTVLATYHTISSQPYSGSTTVPAFDRLRPKPPSQVLLRYL